MTLKEMLDLAHPGNLSDGFRALAIGSLLKSLVAPTQTAETVVVTDHVGTLAHPAIFVQAVEATVGTYTGPCVAGS